MCLHSSKYSSVVLILHKAVLKERKAVNVFIKVDENAQAPKRLLPLTDFWAKIF